MMNIHIQTLVKTSSRTQQKKCRLTKQSCNVGTLVLSPVRMCSDFFCIDDFWHLHFAMMIFFQRKDVRKGVHSNLLVFAALVGDSLHRVRKCQISFWVLEVPWKRRRDDCRELSIKFDYIGTLMGPKSLICRFLCLLLFIPNDGQQEHLDILRVRYHTNRYLPGSAFSRNFL